MRVVKIREYGSSDDLELTEQQYQLLKSYEPKIKIRGGQSRDLNRVEATSYCGNIYAPGLQIVVTPKYPAADVLKMYLLGDGEATPHTLDSLLQKRDIDFWDLVAEALIGEIYNIASQGILRRYVERVENSPFPMGEPLIAQDILANVPVRTGVVSRFEELSGNVVENRALKWGISVLRMITGASFTTRLSAAESLLPGVECPNDCPEFSPFANGSYRTALFLVELLRQSLTTVMGDYGFRGYGVLLDMNKVFEGFVRQRVREACAARGLIVRRKGYLKPLLCEGVSLEPDIVVEDPKTRAVVTVSDCKYKVDWSDINSDVYQMLAYLEGFEGIQSCSIIYPSTECEMTFQRKTMPRNRVVHLVGIDPLRLLDPDYMERIVLETFGLKTIMN